MATLGRFQTFATDDSGNVLTTPTVEVRDEATSNLATLFSDRAGSSGIANPFSGAADGLIAFHVTGGAYKIVITKGAVTRTLRYVGVGTAWEHDTNLDNSNNFVPFNDDGNTLGTSSVRWSDLFLASGGVINWAAGDITLTHSTDKLTLGGGSFVSRIDQRVSSAAAGDITADVSTTDMVVRTALSAGITINAPTGTPIQGDRLVFRLKDNGTARALTWNAIFRAIGTTIPTTTVLSKTTYVAAIYNSTDTKWDVLAASTEA